MNPMNNNAAQLLTSIDALLQRVSVSGDSVFHLAEARQMLKTAYDQLKQGEPEQ